MTQSTGTMRRAYLLQVIADMWGERHGDEAFLAGFMFGLTYGLRSPEHPTPLRQAIESAIGPNNGWVPEQFEVFLREMVDQFDSVDAIPG